MRIYLKYNPAKFHSKTIETTDGCHNKNNNHQMRSNTGSVPDPKIELLCLKFL